MSAFFAFLHHLAAFGLVSALTVEVVLLGGEVTLSAARRLQRADAALGISAGVLLLVGLARVLYFEKGASYYFHNAAFLAKFAVFVVIAAMSIYPSIVFLSWRKATRAGQAPAPAAAQVRMLRRLVHAELAAVVLIVLFAALMARGIGQLA
jgi:putative membrane protein